ncbi:MAG TPA: hydroxymethylglutaryl-CoA reductase, degradative [Candidatus Acidoferrales bacterium]|nr:hydroxymethylglutaryl-CoA reductase, degradative [Candidatus Acidoferrales bacterium]
MAKNSELAGFYKLSVADRVKTLKQFAGLSEEDATLLQKPGALGFDVANRMVENVIGVMPVPLGVAVNFMINGRELVVPMAIEEPSVIAAASNAAKMSRPKGGFQATTTEPVMIGQIQVVGVKDPSRARFEILAQKAEILKHANAQDPVLISLGGGARDLEVRIIETSQGTMVIAELLVDCRDAMGANAVNTMAEAVAPLIEKISGGHVYLRIISNLAVKRLARAKATFAKETLGGAEVVDGIVNAYAFAAADPFRCATHNKGIMNGVTAVVLATGNDTRAIEAGAHSYAARLGHYTSLTTWEKDGNGDLVGTLEMPMAVGLVGGATASNPVAKLAVKLLGIKTARELAEVIVSVGLAQNLAALRALAAEGIQRGHMGLHARNVAISVGATGELIDKVAAKMVAERKVRMDRAKELLEEFSKG